MNIVRVRKLFSGWTLSLHHKMKRKTQLAIYILSDKSLLQKCKHNEDFKGCVRTEGLHNHKTIQKKMPKGVFQNEIKRS